MGIEKFFFHTESSSEEKGEEKIDENKRKTLIGMGALGMASMLPRSEARAADLPELRSLETPEEREQNVEQIFRYAAWLQIQAETLRTARAREEVESIIYANVPALEESALKGTELDFSDFMHEGGWPASWLVYRKKNGTKASANGFTVKNLVAVNQHVAEHFEGCSASREGLDIAMCSLDNKSVVPTEKIKQMLQKPMLGFDEASSNESLHGRIVLVPTNHKTSSGAVKELIPAVLIKITPNFLYREGEGTAFFNKQQTEEFGEQLLHSYMAIVAPLDADENGFRNGFDVEGMSGSPLITLEDAAHQKKNTSGMVWGTMAAEDSKNVVSRSIMFTFGADVLRDMLAQMAEGDDSVNERAEEQESVPRTQEMLTRRIQTQLNVWRQNRGLPPITVDGTYGKETQIALFKFQQETFGRKAQGVLFDNSGLPNEATWEKLFPGEPFVDIMQLP